MEFLPRIRALKPKPSKRSFPAVVLSGLALATITVVGTHRARHSDRLNIFDTTLLAQINVLRTTRGLNQLQLSTQLSFAADEHTREMGRNGYFAHPSSDHTPFSDRIKASYPAVGHRTWAVGENLLYEAPDVGAAEAITAWMRSADHRANLLDPAWRDIGIAARHYKIASGVYNGKPVTILTVDFGVRT